MSSALRVDCPHCGEGNSLYRVLVHLTGVHLRCGACGKNVRVVETVSGVFLTFMAFAVAYGLAFWWLSGLWRPDTWTSWVDPMLVAAIPLVPGVVAALLALALARGAASRGAPAEPLSSITFGVVYVLALMSTIALLLAVWAGGLLLRTGDPMPVPTLPEAPGVAVVQGLDAWTFTELDGTAHTIGSLKGTPVMLHFWRPEEPATLDVLGSIGRLRRSKSEVYYVLVGDAEETAVKAFITDRSVRLPLVRSSMPLPAELAILRSRTMSTTYFLDAQGRLAFAHSGAARWDTEAVERFLDQLR